MINLIDASRLQFAITAMYHWLFVPLTLGLGFILAFMETKYVITGDEAWKKITKFWMKIFAINFAIGLATGIILEFEFGTNWSNYSWFVGDIFGAPLAIEGILAFFLESTFFAVMYFGWDKVSKRFHLLSTWLTAIGTNLSALWILVANAWMQYPVGMEFDPNSARNEMVNFWDIVFSSVAINKFIHTVTNGYVLASIVVIGISAWFLLKRREQLFAYRSMKIAAIFGIISSCILIYAGDGSAVDVGKHQPMKLAAMEGLYEGKYGVPLTAIGILNPKKEFNNSEKEFLFRIEIPQGLSLLADRKLNTFVPGVNDIINGVTYVNKYGDTVVLPSFNEKVIQGNIAIDALAAFNKARKEQNTIAMDSSKQVLKDNFKYFGYGYLNNPAQIVPDIPLIFYTFRIMVFLGAFFLLLFIVILIMVNKQLQNKFSFDKNRWILYISIISVPLVYICSECGWVVSEVGRQPWAIQDLLPVNAAVSGVSSSNVILTIVIFLTIFTALLIAELIIMFNQIKKGPQGIK